MVHLDHFRLDWDENIQITISGGSSSGAQACWIKEANGGFSPNWILLQNNTGLERNETHEFTARLEDHLQHEIVRVERTAANGFKSVARVNVSRNGEPFLTLTTEHIKRKDGTVGPRPLPSDGPRRLCSGELKTKTAHRYLRSLGWGRYGSVIGFRADEKLRVDRRRKTDAKRTKGVVEGGYGIFPMFEAGVKAEDVAAYGVQFDWWLSIPSWQGNCWPACMMMSEWKMKERILLALETDEGCRMIDTWVAMERMPRDRNREFRPGRKSVEQLVREVLIGDMSVDAKALKARPECGTCHD